MWYEIAQHYVGWVPLGCSGSAPVILDHSDHNASKELVMCDLSGFIGSFDAT